MRRKLLIIASFLTLFLSLSSCLKDDVGLYWTDDLSGKMYAEIWRPGFQALSLQPVAGEVTFKFLVNIATDQPPTEDITVKLGIDTAAMGRYNRLKGLKGAKAYKLYPYLQIMDESLVIKAGTRNAYAHVKVWNAQVLDACDNFMAPIAIQSATGGVVVTDPLNNGARLMGLPIANPYAGDYHSTGQFIHPTAGVRDIDEIKTLSTVNCNTVLTTVGDLGGYDLNIKVNADNTVTITGGGNGISELVQDTSLPNVYDPATKTFTLNYYYPGAGGNRVVHEVLVRQ